MLKAIFYSLGGLLLLSAVLASGPAIESALRGRADGSLQWGPALFRALLAFHGLALLTAAIRFRPGIAAAGRSEQPIRNPQSEIRNDHTREFGSFLVLGALLIVATALRLHRLGTCLWYDEVITVLDFIRPPVGMILTSFPNQNQHMLYSLMGHAAIAFFGDNDASVRLPAVLFGVGSIAAVFMLGRSVLSTREGLLAAALMTFSYHHVWFSQSARGYSGLLFFSTLAVWFFIEARRAESSFDSERAGPSSAPAWWAAYVLAVTLGLWIHMTMVFVLAAQGIVYLSSLKRRPDAAVGPSRLSPWLAWMLAGTLTLQLYALSLPEFFRTALHEVSLPGDWTSPLWLVTETLRSFHLGAAVVAVLALGGIVCLAGWLDVLRRNSAAAIQMVVPPVLGGIAMVVLAHNLWPRFFFFSMGFALLLAVHGVFVCTEFVGNRLNRRQWGTAVATVTLALAAAGSTKLLPRCYDPPKQDFTGARDYVEAHRRPGEAVAAVGLAGRAYQDYYAPRWHSPETLDDLRTLQRQSPRLWLVYTLPMHMKTYLPEIWKETETHFRPIMTFAGTLGGGDIVICRPAAATTSFRTEKP